jgi:hypothetical protein
MKPSSHPLLSDTVLDRAFVWLCRQRRRWTDVEEIDLWSPRDALIVKALVLVGGAHMSFPPRYVM